jgi:hypothetical protein
MTGFDFSEFLLYLGLVNEILLDLVIWDFRLAVYIKKS